MNKTDRIFVAGHRGLVGSAVVRELLKYGYQQINIVDRKDVDLTDPIAVRWFFSSYKIDYVFLCAARVGGIKPNNDDPLGFFLQNMAIETNVIMNAAEYGVKKLLFLGSSCIYPRDCPQPIKEEYLLTGPIEKTTEAYGLAKIAGIRLCQWLKKMRGCNFISAMPCNIFGPGDHYDPNNAHCLPGLIARIHAAAKIGAPEFFVWGNKTTMREFLYSEDLARALILCMKKYDGMEPINTGSSFEITMDTLAQAIARMIGYTGEIKFDPSQPAGTPRKILDNSKIFALGWKPQIEFSEALIRTYDDFLRRDCHK